MPYAYGMQNAPVVGNGLGGLPRRTSAVTTTVATPQAVGPYYLSRIGFTGITLDHNWNYSPWVTQSNNYSDGTYTGIVWFNIKYNNFNYIERSYNSGSFGLKTTGGNATVWVVSTGTNYFRWIYCLKHDMTGACAMDVNNNPAVSQNWSNTACYETVDGVDTYYYLNYNNSVCQLSKVTPTYSTQVANQSASAHLTFNYSGSGRQPWAMFINGDFLYVVVKSGAYFHLDKHNKSDLTYVSTARWGLTSQPINPGAGQFAETATTLAIRYNAPVSDLEARVFVIDKVNLKGYNLRAGISADASLGGNLFSSLDEIYLAIGGGSGGNYGYTDVYALRQDKIIKVGSQTCSGSTSTFVNSLRGNIARGFCWNAGYYPVGGSSTSNHQMIFVPQQGKTFSYTAGNFTFSQSWNETAQTPISPTDFTLANATTTNMLTPTFSSFNPLGTTYITV